MGKLDGALIFFLFLLVVLCSDGTCNELVIYVDTKNRRYVGTWKWLSNSSKQNGMRWKRGKG